MARCSTVNEDRRDSDQHLITWMNAIALPDIPIPGYPSWDAVPLHSNAIHLLYNELNRFLQGIRDRQDISDLEKKKIERCAREILVHFEQLPLTSVRMQKAVDSVIFNVETSGFTNRQFTFQVYLDYDPLDHDDVEAILHFTENNTEKPSRMGSKDKILAHIVSIFHLVPNALPAAPNPFSSVFDDTYRICHRS